MKTITSLLLLLSLPWFSGAQNLGLPIWPSASVDGQFFQTIDWRDNPPAIDSRLLNFPDSIGAMGAAFGICGELLFYVMHNGSKERNQLFLYATDGSALYPTQGEVGLNGVRGRQEIQVVPIPNKINQWYIIYREWSTSEDALFRDAAYKAAAVLYCRVSWENGTVRVFERDIPLRADGQLYTYNDGMAVSRTTFNRTDACYLYLTRRSKDNPLISVDRFIIEESGISWEANSGERSVGYYDITHAGSPIELDSAEHQLAVVNRNFNSGLADVLILDTRDFNIANALLIEGGELILMPDGQANDQSAVLPDMLLIKQIARDTNYNLRWLNNFDKKLSQVEFSPNGRFLYLLGGGFVNDISTHLSYLAQVDLSTSPLSVRLQVQATPGGNYTRFNGVGCPLSQCGTRWNRLLDIQKAFNGELYFTKQSDSTLYIIPNANQPMSQNLIPSSIDLSNAQYRNIQLPTPPNMLIDQIDGFDYLAAQHPPLNDVQLELELEIEACDEWVKLHTRHNADTNFIAYEWYLNGERLLGQNSASIDITQSGRYQAQLLVYPYCNAEPIRFTAEQEVVIPEPLAIADLSVRHTSCGDRNGRIKLGARNGLPPYEYSFDNGVNYSLVDSIDGLQAGFYFIKVRDARGCTVFQNVIVNISPPLMITALDITDASCRDANGSFTVSLNDSSHAPEFSIDGSNFQPLPVFTGLMPGKYDLSVRDTLGCQIDTIISLDDQLPPVIQLMAVVPANCDEDNGSIEVQASSNQFPLQYTLNGGASQDSGNFTNLSQGVYQLRVRDKNDCESQIEVEVGELPLPEWENITVQETTCGEDNGQIVVEAIGQGLEYSIDGVDFQAASEFFDVPAGSYTLLLRDEQGCQLQQPVVVEDSPRIEIQSVQITTATCNQSDGQLEIRANGGSGELSYRLNGQQGGTNTWSGIGEGNYEISINDETGCTADTLVAMTPFCPIFVPNVFTPDGNGYNDKFRLYGTLSKDFWVLRYLIFDRWGALIYKAENFSIHSSLYWWDGTYKGQLVNSGTYVYFIEISRLGQGIELLRGDISVLR